MPGFTRRPADHVVAQRVSNCPRSQADAYLDVNGVRACILNTDGLFYRGAPHVYEVGGANAIFAANIWIAGLMNGELHAAATHYGEWDFWAGPLDEEGHPPIGCYRYDHVWEITRADLESYTQAGIPTKNLLHGTAFAFEHPRSFIDNTTFYRYTFINKNTVPLEAAYYGFFA